jgi:hypothetical protein
MRGKHVIALLVLVLAPGGARAQAINPTAPLPYEQAHFDEASPPTDSVRTPGQAVQLSDAYYTRLTIHRYASYAELPLFGAQYLLGNKLINGTISESTRTAHKVVGFTLGGLFAVNTVTGVWNLIESRHEKEGRGTRLLHAGLMLAADAGFAYTGTLASNATHGTQDDKRKHRNAALVSMGFATTGTLVMWLR